MVMLILFLGGVVGYYVRGGGEFVDACESFGGVFYEGECIERVDVIKFN